MYFVVILAIESGIRLNSSSRTSQTPEKEVLMVKRLGELQ